MMKKILILFIPLSSIFVISAIIATYFLGDTLNFIKFVGGNFSAVPTNPDFKILLWLGLAGIFGIHRKRRNQ
jgi:hypothetical protein